MDLNNSINFISLIIRILNYLYLDVLIKLNKAISDKEIERKKYAVLDDIRRNRFKNFMLSCVANKNLFDLQQKYAFFNYPLTKEEMDYLNAQEKFVKASCSNLNLNADYNFRKIDSDLENAFRLIEKLTTKKLILEQINYLFSMIFKCRYGETEYLKINNCKNNRIKRIQNELNQMCLQNIKSLIITDLYDQFNKLIESKDNNFKQIIYFIIVLFDIIRSYEVIDDILLLLENYDIILPVDEINDIILKYYINAEEYKNELGKQNIKKH